jgi:zinc D-Ala-D-Ala carboxypeptidase
MSSNDKVQLSDHFALWEFTTSQEAERQHIDNTPSAEVISHLRTLCGQILEPARAALGPLRISSGYRSPALNAAVGGSRNSDSLPRWTAAGSIAAAAERLHCGAS